MALTLPPRVKPGDLITSDWMNQVLDALAALDARAPAAAPPAEGAPPVAPPESKRNPVIKAADFVRNGRELRIRGADFEPNTAHNSVVLLVTKDDPAFEGVLRAPGDRSFGVVTVGVECAVTAAKESEVRASLPEKLFTGGAPAAGAGAHSDLADAAVQLQLTTWGKTLTYTFK